MAEHRETREVRFSARQMYDLVADISRYPEFIPWCEALRIRKQNVVDGQGEMIADMVVRYKFFLEKFQSRVELEPDDLTVSATYLKGPFENLENRWHFEDKPEGGSIINFTIDFQFKNRLLQAVAMEVFDRAFKKMSNAFLERAEDLYGVTS